MEYMTVDEFGASPKGSVGAHVVYLTPSSHHPTSVALSPQRRRRFLSLADEQDAVIIEVDYDAEIRLQGPPLAPMKSVDRSGRVVYLGTFSKYLAPGLRMGYGADCAAEAVPPLCDEGSLADAAAVVGTVHPFRGLRPAVARLSGAGPVEVRPFRRGGGGVPA